MSWKASAFVKALTNEQHPSLTAGHKCLLYTLADYYDEEEGAAWPTIARLATESLCSSRTAIRYLAQLIKMNILCVEQFRDGESTRNSYSFVQYSTGISTVTNCHGGKSSHGDKNLFHGDTAVSHKPPIKPQEKDSEFSEHILSVYPRRIALEAGRKRIREAIGFLVKTKKLTERDAAALLYRKTAQFKLECEREAREEKFIPHPATWFHQKRYLDGDSAGTGIVVDRPMTNPAELVRAATRRTQ